jgi:fructokinase
MEARWGVRARELGPTHPAWALEAHYLALGVGNLALALSPQRILLGGGVMQQPHLFDLIRDEFARLLNGYVQHSEIIDHLDRYIMPPQLGSSAGVLGSLILAEQKFLGQK